VWATKVGTEADLVCATYVNITRVYLTCTTSGWKSIFFLPLSFRSLFPFWLLACIFPRCLFPSSSLYLFTFPVINVCWSLIICGLIPISVFINIYIVRPTQLFSYCNIAACFDPLRVPSSGCESSPISGPKRVALLQQTNSYVTRNVSLQID
jgi:hypothetical protein